MKKQGQVTFFIVVALVIVVGIVVYFAVNERIGEENIPVEFAPVFNFYTSCIEREAKLAIEFAGSQGGYVSVPDYVAGSEYAPFSSQLNFLGTPIPYWFYVSGNGLVKEQVPSKQDIENEIAQFVAESLAYCTFESFYAQNFSIKTEDPRVDVEILEDEVNVEVIAAMIVSRDKESGRKTRHRITVASKLGKFYNLAQEIYATQMEKALFENYGIDVLRLYTPVDGVEVQCGPKIWSTRQVVAQLKEGLEANIGSIKFNGEYYTLSNETRKYFVIDTPADESIQLLYSRTWPTKVEIVGEEVNEEIMIAESIGTQAGLGAMGFCYVPYHFVYDISFPVLIQLYNNEELFQFPVAVIIENNRPRNALLSATPLSEEEEFDLCAFSTQEIVLHLFDVNLNKVNANISYECFDQRCLIGETRDGRLQTMAPACVNGYLRVRADGYAEKKQLFSTNDERFADLILEREHEIEIALQFDSEVSNATAIVSFVKDDGYSVSAALPEVKNVKLSEGSYEVSVYVYGDSDIVLPPSTKTHCQEIPRGGLLGFFGITKEECFVITLPKTRIEYSLIGGGIFETYLLESELEKGKVIVHPERLSVPNSIESLQQNFELFSTRRVNLEFIEDDT